MLWKRTQSNASRTGRKLNVKLSMRAFLSLSFFSVGLWALPFSASAEDSTNDVVQVVGPLTLDDLDEDTRIAVTNLARAISSPSSVTSTEDNTLAILNLLNALVTRPSSSAAIARTYPFAYSALNNGNAIPFATWIGLLLGSGVDNQRLPTASQSYLWQLRQLIYGGSIPSSSDALLPTVWEIADFLPNLTNSPSADLSFSNALYSVGTSGRYSIADLAAIQAAFFNGMSDPDSAGGNFEHLLYNLDSVNWQYLGFDVAGTYNYVSSFDDAMRRYGSGNNETAMWAVRLEDLDTSVASRLQSVIEDGTYNIYDALLYLSGGIDHLTDIGDSINNIRTNIVSNGQEEYENARYQVAIDDEEYQGAHDYQTAMEDALSDTDVYLDNPSNQPNFEVSYVDNPMEPISGAIDFSQTMRSKLPDVSNIDTKSRVYIFKTQWDHDNLLTRRGLGEVSFDLSGSDPHVPNQLYNYASVIMAWAWNMAAMICAFMAFRNFWDWVASFRA